MNILLGITGSVAAILIDKIYDDLSKLGDVKIICTDNSKHFIGSFSKKIYTDSEEWSNYHLDKKVLHIDLKNWADVLVIAPLSANTMAKMANGLSDNLLTSVIRAWNWYKPIILAPAMNCDMWNNPLTNIHMKSINNIYKDVSFCNPVKKTLACGDFGIGAMANISDITSKIKDKMKWSFPLFNPYSYNQITYGIPVDKHPGSFGAIRKYDIHTGVDIYCEDKTRVYAVEDGEITSIYPFTGEIVGTGWWEETYAIAVKGKSGIVLYGELCKQSVNFLNKSIGDEVKAGGLIGRVKRVLPEDKLRKDIQGHSTSMLHIEIYDRNHKTNRVRVKDGSEYDMYDSIWSLNEEKPNYLIDPTPYLKECYNGSIEYYKG